MIGLIAWTLVVFFLGMFLANKLLEHNRNRKAKEMEFRALNRRVR